MALPMESIQLLYPTFNLTPNENPLSDAGKWSSFWFNIPPLMVSSSGAAVHGTVVFAINGSVYLAKNFQGDVIEAYGCAPTASLGAAVESHRIVALVGDPYAYNGYASGYGGAIGPNYYFLRKYISGTNVVEIDAPGIPGPDPYLGIRLTPTHVEQWGYYGGAWHLIQSMADTTYRGPTWFALQTEEEGGTAEVAWTCFAAGVPNRTQIYRLVRGLATEG